MYQVFANALRLAPLIAFYLIQAAPIPAWALPRTWIGGNVDWVDGGSTANWTPADEPDSDDEAIFNTPNGVNLGSDNIVSALTMSGGIDLLTNNFQILVVSQTTIDGVGSTIRVDPYATPPTPAFQTLDLDLNNGGALVMNGGFASVTREMEINASVLQGFGTINLGDFDFVVEQAFENSGLIQVIGTTTTPGTLTLHANATDVIDLDGTTETGVVDVANANADVEFDTLTLVVDGPLTDAFSGTLQIGRRDTITFNDNFTMSGADVELDGGTNVATMNGPAAVTSITSSAFNVTGSTVITNDLTFSGTGNTITINAGASLQLDGTVTIPDASALALSDGASELIVTGSTTINEAAGNFNWDGNGTADTTVSGSGNLAITANMIDTGDDTYGGTLTLNDGGDVSVNNTANVWTMAATINKTGASVSTISGEALNVTGAINAGGTGTLDLPLTTLASTANVNVTSRLTLGTGSVLAGPATLTGIVSSKAWERRMRM